MINHDCMDDKVQISIIIPVYNTEKYLKRCLDSILMQTFQNFEVIIVDDGSVDATGRIIEEFLLKDSRIKKYYQNNQGPLHARLTGLKLSIGLFFTFCDADDYYSSDNSLQIMYDAICGNACDVVQFNSYIKYHLLKKRRNHYFDSVVSSIDFHNLEYPKILCSYWDEAKISVTVWDKIYNRNLVKNIPDNLYSEITFMGDDLLLNLFLLERCEKFMFSSQCVYCYNTLIGSTNRWKEKDLIDLDVIKKYQAQVIERCCIEKKDRIWRNYYAEIASWLFLHIKAGTEYLTKKQLIEYLQVILKFDSFLLAQEYFRFQNNENWEAVNLLREADPKEYLLSVYNEKDNLTFLNKIKSTIKRII